MSAHEVVIVGGGPAGASTALFLAARRPDLADRIVVLEKERYPRDKYCAGGLGGRADVALAAIGVSIDVPSVPIHGVSAAFEPGGIAAREGAIGRVVRRVEYDHALARAARDRGVRIVEGARVSAVAFGDAGAVVESAAGTFRGAVVVGADGVGSVVRRAMGVPFGRVRAQVVEVDTEPVASDGPRDLIHFDLRDRSYAGYVWDFPTVVDGRALVCRGAYVLSPDALGPGGAAARAPDPEAVLRARLAELGLDPARYRVKRFAERGLEPALGVARPRALLVGEAAGIDPLLGEGIAQAIAYGALAGDYLARALEARDLRFHGWAARVRRSVLGLDLGLRSAVMPRFYGAHRDVIERALIAEPAILRLGMQYFGGKPPRPGDAARGVARAALVAARVGLAGAAARRAPPGRPFA